MTKTFDKFLKQYRATGREKGDGYDSSHFDGLTTDELSTTEDMLIKDAMQLDTTAIQGLGELKSDQAENTLRCLLDKVKSPNGKHLCIVKALWEITHDLALQNLILEDYFCKDDVLKKHAAIALLFTEPSSTTYKTFMDILRTEDKESDLKYTATRGILFYYGLLPTAHDFVNYQKYLPLVRILTDSADEKTLAIAIAEVEEEAAKIKV